MHRIDRAELVKGEAKIDGGVDRLAAHRAVGRLVGGFPGFADDFDQAAGEAEERLFGADEQRLAEADRVDVLADLGKPASAGGPPGDDGVALGIARERFEASARSTDNSVSARRSAGSENNSVSARRSAGSENN